MAQKAAQYVVSRKGKTGVIFCLMALCTLDCEKRSFSRRIRTTLFVGFEREKLIPTFDSISQIASE
jgi:hypothetical protein